MHWAISSLSFQGSLPDKMQAAADAGFRQIEIFLEDVVAADADPQDIAAFAQDLGLTIVSLQSLRDFEAAPETRRGWNYRRAERHLDLAARLGAGMLIVTANTRPDTLADPARAAADLVDLADKAAARGLRLGYEALSGGAQIRDYRAAWGIVERAGRPNLGLVIGTAHTHFAGRDLAELEYIDPARIFLVHLADAPDMKMDSRLFSSLFRLFPGQGDLPLRDLHARLAAHGYDGPVSLEIFNGQMRGLSPAQVATDGVRSLHWLTDADAESRDAIEGIAFVEIASFDEKRTMLVDTLAKLGFVETHRHRTKKVGLWSHGDAHVILNEDPHGHAHSYHLLNGLSVCAVGYRVRGMKAWMKRLADYRAGRIQRLAGPDEMDMPAIHGIDGGLLFFLDADAPQGFIEADFERRADAPVPGQGGLAGIDHFSQAVSPTEFYSGVLFYRALMGFAGGEQVGVIDPHGAIQSRNLRNATDTVRLSVNTSFGANSSTQRFLSSRMGAGYQHFAFACDDLFAFAARVDPGIVMAVPGSYYDTLPLRFDLDSARLEAMRRLNILYDEDANGRFFQLYTLDINGLFFEIVQREGGYAGFGAANAPVRMAAQSRRFVREQAVLLETAELF